jgi:hypothetical protein
MLRIRNLRNKYQKRLIRPLYAQTQATPYAAVLDSTFRDTTNTFVAPAGAFLYKGGLVPGTVMTGRGDAVLVATGAAPATSFQGSGAAGQTLTGPLPFGLLANFVGGDLDDLGDENFVGVWRGPDSVFEILSPGFNDTNLSTLWAASTSGNPVPLYAGADGRLAGVNSGASGVNAANAGTRVPVAYLIERPAASRIVVDLKV